MADENKNELATELLSLADKAAAGELTDQDKVRLKELGESQNPDDLPERLRKWASEAKKLDGMSAQARRELLEAGVDASRGLIPRHAFDQLSPVARTEALKAGVKIVDVQRPIEKREIGANEISRKDFDALGAADRTAKIKAGVRVIDMPA